MRFRDCTVNKDASNYSSPSIQVFSIKVKNFIMNVSDNQAIIDDPNIVDD